MHKLVVTIALLVTAFVPKAAAGDAEPFATLHERLSQAAEQSLTNLKQAPAAVPDEPAVPDVQATLASFAERFWNGREDQVRRALERVQAHRALMDPILRAEGVPLELASVVLVESAGNTTALSPAGARGLWQFIPGTARRYGLQVAVDRDDRLDVEKATRAAARHLRELHGRFGSWELALAAYNAGSLAVERAIKRGGTDRFLRLSEQGLLPAETRNYVPAVLAAADLFGDAGMLRHAPAATAISKTAAGLAPAALGQ